MKFSKLLILSALLFSDFVNSQITPNGNSGSSTTVYSNGSPDDPIYIWCAEGLSNNTASLTATAPSGIGPYTYDWFYHNQATSSWANYSSSVGANSTISALASDGYRVQIYDNGGALVGCYVAWVWNMNGEVTASNAASACNASNLTGTVSSNGSFTYYNPPPPESLITASTQFNVCFTASHTFVSDVGFYLVGPASCGSPTILLSPNPGSNGQGSVCNSGNNISNLCFSSTSASILNVCTAAVPLSGTYGGYGASATMINWAPLIGCNAAAGGWAVQIYDCIGADVGVLQNANISFSNLASVCGSPTTINYTSGAISSAINDNSCSAATASIFQVPVNNNLITPITVNASTTYLWTATPVIAIPSASSSLTPSVTNLPNGNTMFYLTETVSFGGTSCTYVDSTQFTNTCCTAVADAGADVSFCTGSNSQIGTPAVAGMTYSWSPATGLNDATLAQPTVTLTNAGASPTTTTYTLTITNTAGGCTDVDDVVATVNPLPVVSAGSYPVTCQDAADLTLNGTPIGGSFSGTGVTSGMFDPSLGSQTVTYAYTDGNGCSNSANSSITVVGSSSVNAGSYAAVCIDAADVVLAGIPSGGTFSGTGVTGNLFDPSSGTQTINYDYVDVNGCSGSATTTIIVNQLPIVNAGSDVVICAAGAVTLNASGPGTPVWSPSNGLSSTSVLNPSASPASSTTYTLTLTENGCSDSDDAVVTVIPNPNLSVTGDQSICDGDCSNLTASGADFYLWAPSADIVDPTLENQSVCPTATTTYDVTGFIVSGNSVLNGDFSGGAVNFNSDYNLNSDTQVEGTYFVTTNANFTHPGFTGVDHTTGTGNFMVVNGSGTPNSSVWCQTIAVQPNTDYIFSTWVSTLALGSPAILQFSINGSTIGAPFNAPVNINTWDEFYSTWNSGTATSATICIVNQNTSTGGNDFGIDDIFFSALCSSTESITVTVNPLPNINAGTDVTICEGQSVTLSGSNGTSYSWNNGVSNGQSFVPSSTGSFTVTGTDANGCVNTDDVNVTLLPPPSSSFTADSLTGYPGLTVNFTNVSQDASGYLWIFGNGQMSSPSTTVGQTTSYGNPGTYTVYLIADNDYCSDTSSLNVVIIPFPPLTIHVPNVFTPNSDGANDEFFISTTWAKSMNVIILNRWGNVVHEITDLTSKWNGEINGKEASDGVYFFKYEVEGINGDILTGHGNITLIR